MRHIATLMLITAACGLVPPGAAWAQVERLTQAQAGAGLSEALERGARAAVARLGHENGFLEEARFRIPLPDALARAENTMRRFGMGERADELVLAMNRAAESAVSQATPLLVDAVKRMTWQDAKAILAGGDTAGTEYFRRTTHDALHARFLPVVQSATDRAQLGRKYDAFAGHAARFGLVKEEDARLNEYVTRRALDALYVAIGEEERRFRKDPLAATSKLLQTVFGSLRGG